MCRSLTAIDWAIVVILALIAILVICATAERTPLIKEGLILAIAAALGWHLIQGLIFHHTC